MEWISAPEAEKLLKSCVQHRRFDGVNLRVEWRRTKDEASECVAWGYFGSEGLGSTVATDPTYRDKNGKFFQWWGNSASAAKDWGRKIITSVVDLIESA